MILLVKKRAELQMTKMDDISGAKDAMRKRVLETGMQAAMDDPMMAALSDVAPPFNPTATEPHMIYDWTNNDRGVIPLKYFKTVDGSTYANLLQNKPSFMRARRNEDDEYYSGVLNLLDIMVQLAMGSKELKQNGKVVQILHWLIDMYRFLFVREEGERAPRGSVGVPNAEVLLKAFEYGENKMPSKELANYWLKLFKQDGEGEIVQFNKMRMLSYMFVFCICNVPKSRLRFGILAESLDIDPQKMVPRVAEGIGCERVMSTSKATEQKEETQGSMWRLVAPLNFERTGKRRRR